MTTVSINKVGTDSVELELMQTGSYTTSVDLRDNLLDNALSYHFCVTELNVPLQQSPLFPITEDKLLFEAVRRNVGVGILADGGSLASVGAWATEQNDFNIELAEGNIDADDLEAIYGTDLGLDPELVENDFEENFDQAVDLVNAEYRNRIYTTSTESMLPSNKGSYHVSPHNPFFDTGDFCKDLSRWVRQFNYETSKLGVQPALHGDGDEIPPVDVAGKYGPANNPYEFLRLSLTCDGSLEIIGFPIFWNNFMIRFTSYGAALLGVDTKMLDRNLLAFTRVGVDTLPYSVHDILDDGGLLVPADIRREVLVDTVSPIFETSDQRVKVSVESHLPITSNKEIVDEKETVSREICEVFFENQIETETKYDSGGNYSGIALKTRLYSGQTALIRRSDRHQNWVRLTTSFEIKFFRFFLHIHYRVWVDATPGTPAHWNIQQQNLNVPDDAYWIMNLRFVSDV